MPISDEVIELAPVKKTKSKLIIMFVVMGLLLAAAVTFLVLYFLKPNVEQTTGRVNDISVEASSLFTKTAGSDTEEPVNYVSVGHQYTVYATVSAEGTAAKEVSWLIEPANAIRVVNSGLVEGSDNKFFYTFEPTAALADKNQEVVVTARSTSDSSKLQRIKFFVVRQGTEHIIFDRYRRGSTNTAITDGKVTVPYYSTAGNNDISYVTFTQKGAYDAATDKYAEITVVETDGGRSNDVEVKPADSEGVISIVSSTPSQFGFRVNKVGTAIINVTANVHNDSEPVTQQLKVEVKSNASFNLIDSMYLYSTPRTEAFYEKYVDSNGNLYVGGDNKFPQPSIGETITLPYDVRYDNILSHLLINPVKLQYAVKDEGDVKKGIIENWFSKLSLTAVSGNTSILDVNKTSAGQIQILGVGLGETTLTIRDSSSDGINSAATINVRVVAANTTGSVSVLTAGKEYSRDEIIKINEEEGGIPTSPGVTSQMTISYFVQAPEHTNVDDLSRKFISNKFYVEFDEKNIEVRIGTSVMQSGKELMFSDTLKFTPDSDAATNKKYTGKATFNVSVKSGAPNKSYTLVFHKVGTSITGTDDWNDKDKFDRSWEETVKFNVVTIASSAGFIPETEAKAIVTNNGAEVGGFIKKTDTEAQIFVQNRADGAALPFDLKRFVKLNGLGSVEIALSNISDGFEKTKDGSLQFTGTVVPDNLSQVTVTYTAKNNAGNKIGNDLNIKIFIIDAVTELYSRDSADKIVTYTGSAHASVTKDLLYVKRTFAKAETVYDNSTDLDLYVGSKKLYKYPVGDVSRFKFNETDTDELFEYDGSKIVALLDIFEYVYRNKSTIDAIIDSISIEYKLGSSDVNWAAEGFVSQKRKVILQRTPDDVKLYTSPQCGASDEIQLSVDGSYYDYPISQFAPGSVYSSAVVRLEGGQNLVIWRDASDLAHLIGTVYFDVPKNNGTPISDSLGNGTYESGYTSIVFSAPQAGDVNGTNYTASVHGALTIRNLRIVVKNLARPVDGIAVFKDSGYTDAFDATNDKFVFGKYFGGSNNVTELKEHTFYVRIYYSKVDKESPLSTFEKVDITFPSYFEVSIDDGNFRTAATDKSTHTYNLSPTDADKTNSVYDSDHVGYRVKFTIRLSDSALRSNGDITVVEAHEVPDRKSFRIPYVIDTALGTISFTHGEVTLTTDEYFAADFRHTFNLASIEDALTSEYVVGIGYNALASYEYGGSVYDNLKYDTTHLSVVTPVVSGLKFTTSFKESPYIKIVLDKDAFSTASEYKCVFEFADNTNGFERNFTVTITVNIAMDIFAMDTEENGYEFVTTGGAGETATQKININYNGEKYNATDSRYQPDAVVKNTVDKFIVKKGVNGYERYNGNDIYVDNDSNIHVKNGVLVGKSGDDPLYMVRVLYKNITVDTPIVITTQANGIKLAESGNDASIKQGADEYSYTAKLSVSDKNTSFGFVAKVFNLGSGAYVEGAVPEYKLYRNSARTQEIKSSDAKPIAVIDNGRLTFKYPVIDVDGLGRIYYSAIYSDASSGKTYTIRIDIEYTVDIASVTVGKVSGDYTYDAARDAFILYLGGNKTYTTVDIMNFINVTTAFEDVAVAGATKYTVVSDNTAVASVSGTVITPLSIGNGKITIIAENNGTRVQCECNVIVAALPEIDVDIDSAEINAVYNESVVASWGNENDVAGFDVGYNVTENGGSVFEIIKDANKATLSFANRNSSNLYGSHTFTVTATYTLASGSQAQLVGNFVKSKTLTVDVVGIAPPIEFTLKDNEGNTVAEGSTKTVDGNEKYTAEITVPTDSWYIASDWAYSIECDNSDAIASVTSSGNVVTFGFGAVRGTLKFTVTATVYGKTYRSAEKSYTFSAGAVNIAVNLSASSNGGHSYTDVAASVTSYAIDYDTTPYKFKFAVSSDNENVPVSVVKYDVIGDVEQTVAGNEVIITAKKPTELVVRAVVDVAGRQFVTESRSLKLTATAPQFALSAGKTTLIPGESTEVHTNIVDGTGFKGSFEVEYQVLSGNGRVSGHELTAGTQKSESVITLRSTCRVEGGVFDGAIYTIDKTFDVVVPSVTWNITDTKLGVGDGIDVSNYVSLSTGTPSAFTFTPSSGLASNVYTVSGSNLTVNNINAAHAGGKLTVKYKVTLFGVEYESDALAVTIVPSKANAVVGYSVNGIAGAYDIKSAVKPYFASGDGVILENDGYSVEYAMKNSVEGVSVSGSVLTLKKNFSSSVTVELDATVTLSAGEYAGTKLVCTVNIRLYSDVSSLSVSANWNGNGYGAVGVAGMIPSSVTSISAINNIEVNILDNSAFAAISGNGTAAPAITVDRNANVAGGVNNISEIPVALTVTLNNGAVYYIVGKITVDEITPELTAVCDGSDFANGSTLTLGAGKTAVLVFAEKHGLSLSDITVTGASGSLDVAVGGNSVVISAADSSFAVSVKGVKVTLKAEGAALSYTFDVNILASVSDVYAADVTEFAVKQSDGGSHTSVLTSNSVYKYAHSMDIIGSSDLSAMLSEVTVNGASVTPSGNGVSIDLTSGGTRPAASTVNIVFRFKNAINVGDYTFSVRLRTYNAAVGGDYCDSSVTYSVKVANTINVSFDVNGGSSSHPAFSASFGYAYGTVNFTDAVRDGYTFDGWFTERDGGERVVGTAIVSIPTDHVLYAHWSANEYTVMFDAAGGEAVSDIRVTYDSAYGELPVPVRTGYTFVAWHNADVTGDVVTDKTVVKITAAQTLVAEWTADKYVVTLEANGGSIDDDVYEVTFGGVYGDIPSATPAAGYKFIGWFTRPVGGDEVNAATAVEIAADHVIYAHYEPVRLEYDVTLVIGDARSETIHVVYGETYSALASVSDPVKSGYEFIGWYNGDTLVTSSSKVTEKSAHELTAKFAAKKIVVILNDIDMNGGNGIITVTYGSAYGECVDFKAPDAVVGYTFDGWYTQKTGGTQVTADTLVTDEAPHNLYARWTVKTYSVTLEYCDGVTASETKTDIEHGTSTSVFGTPERDGYTFDGWYTQAAGGDKVETVSDGRTLYAQWKSDVEVAE